MLADAFVDGELGGRDLAGFEAHLAVCAQCQAAVTEARTLKASVAALPEFAAPRSFSLTPEMVALPVAPTPRKSGTPLYLGFARAGAALSIGAFATVLALSALGSNGQQSADSSKGAFELRETMSDATTDGVAANSSAGPGKIEQGPVPAAAPTATPAPLLAPATAGGVSGAGAATAAAPSPMPPSTGADPNLTPTEAAQRTMNDTAAGTPAGGGLTIDPVPDSVASSELFYAANEDDDDGFGPWTVALGALAAVSIAVLGFLEISRRRAN